MISISTLGRRGILGTGVFCAALLGVASVGFSADEAATAAATSTDKAPAYPTPSINQVAWQIDFTHGLPQRIVVQVPGEETPKAYWYLTYHVTNNTDTERTFLPVFEMLTSEGKVFRSDNNIAPVVFESIKAREKNQFLEPALSIAGVLRLGEDQAKDGVAIWEEPMPEMGSFSIFVGGLSGEAQTVKGPGDKDVILRKSLQLDYVIFGDEVYPGEDKVHAKGETWVMR